jgi:UDP-N-acetylmuramoylalanine--D-glutamate ligase
MSSYYDIHISPHVAVVTSDIDFDVLNYQTYNNFIVAPDQVVDSIKFQKNFQSKAKILRTRGNLLPNDWNLAVNTLHDKDNYALVMQACELFKASADLIRETIQKSTNPRGSIEFIKKVDNIEYYNDANSSNPDSTLSALKSISAGKNIVLILGGAYTGYDYTHLIKDISKYVSTIILLPGSGSLGIRSDIEKMENVNFFQVLSLDEAVKKADEVSKRGDRVLFSPAFDAVGIDISRKERGEKFVKSVRSL